MNNSELPDIRSTLISILEKNNYTWVVEQWREEISKGKFSTKSVKDLKQIGGGYTSDYFAIAKKSYSAKENIVVSEPYTLKEEVELLIASIEEGLILPFRIAEESIKSLNTNQPVSELVFQDESDGVKTTSINTTRLTQIESSCNKLNELLAELKKELINAN